MRKLYRCIHDIVYDILEVVADSIYIGKTRLCSYANLPLDRCSEILDLLMEYGFIIVEEHSGRNVYSLTERGYEYIGLYRKLHELLPLPHRGRHTFREQF